MYFFVKNFKRVPVLFSIDAWERCIISAYVAAALAAAAAAGACCILFNF
jgi:hypothetical protein